MSQVATVSVKRCQSRQLMNVNYMSLIPRSLSLRNIS
jgi:hypothetical protein